MCKTHGPRDAADLVNIASDLDSALGILDGLISAIEELSGTVDHNPAKRLAAISAITCPMVSEMKAANAACERVYAHVWQAQKEAGA